MDYKCECGWKISDCDADYVVTCLCGKPMKPLISEKASGSKVPCSAGLKGRLITAAASLSLHKLSAFDDDYPQRFPKRVLREIEKHNDHLSDIARELMSIKDAL